MKRPIFALPVVLATFSLSLVSCDKIKDLAQSATEKVKELKDGKEDVAQYEGVVDVLVVSEKEGKAIIVEESRLVMVEFYSDT